MNGLDKIPIYTLCGKYMIGSQLVALAIMDNNGNRRILKMDNIYALIRKGLIQGCTLIEHEGNIHIKSEQNKIANLPLVGKDGTTDNTKYTLVGRIFKNEGLIGYAASDEKTKVYNLSKDKVWELARQGKFTNLTATMSNNTRILRGVGISIKDLPKVKV